MTARAVTAQRACQRAASRPLGAATPGSQRRRVRLHPPRRCPVLAPGRYRVRYRASRKFRVLAHPWPAHPCPAHRWPAHPWPALRLFPQRRPQPPLRRRPHAPRLDRARRRQARAVRVARAARVVSPRRQPLAHRAPAPAPRALAVPRAARRLPAVRRLLAVRRLPAVRKALAAHRAVRTVPRVPAHRVRRVRGLPLPDSAVRAPVRGPATTRSARRRPGWAQRPPGGPIA